MSEIQKLKEENKFLKQKMLELQEKLKIAETWMSREVKEAVKKISKRKITSMTCSTRDKFLKENIENIISNKIREYFWDYILMNLSTNIINNIISAEISYYNLRQNPNFDGFSVISSYHKALDAIIESIITKWYRKFAKKNWYTILRKNDPLEKTLNLVINKWYILSVWRLYHLLSNIKENKNLYDFTKAFKLYLDKYQDLKNILLNEEFLKIFKQIIDSEILGKKRHSWNINFQETRKARKLLIWDLKDKNSLIYHLVKFWDIEY